MAKAKKQAAEKVARRVFDDDARKTVEQAIHALHSIRYLAISASCEAPATVATEAYCEAIRSMSELHGKALDDCVVRVTGHPAVGCFDKEYIDRE